MAKASDPYFSFFPALPLSRTLRLGDWCIGNPGSEVRWRSPRFKKLAQGHLNAFAKQGFEGGALMWHNAHGFDGSMPEPQVWAAVRATVCFVALDANDHVRDDPNAAYYVATSENAELYTQPIDESKGFITQQQGGLLKRVLSVGSKIGEEVVTLPDAVVALMKPVIPSQHLASALFDALLDTSTQVNRRIAVALDWHRFALSNPRAISWQQRLISLKTGFEALSGESKTHLCAKFLRALFEDTTRPYTDMLPWAGILWSPLERTDLARSWLQGNTRRAVIRSELEDWFTALGDARNEIIHEGTFGTGVYEAPRERPLSRYAGPLFWTADRLLRETVKALLGADVLLCGLLKDRKAAQEFGRKVLQILAQAQETAQQPRSITEEKTAPPTHSDDDRSSQHNTSPRPPQPMRDLPTLLAALECDAANKILLSKVVPRSASTSEGAQRNAEEASGKWKASFLKRSMLITADECDRLKAAGAEFPLPRYWTRCD
jgi:hypothetical protein